LGEGGSLVEGEWRVGEVGREKGRAIFASNLGNPGHYPKGSLPNQRQHSVFPIAQVLSFPRGVVRG